MIRLFSKIEIRKIIWLMILFLLGCTVEKKGKKVVDSSYRGLIYQSYDEIKGWKHEQGKILVDQGGNWDKQYAITVFISDRDQLIFFEQLLQNDDELKYKILDYSVVNDMKRDQYIMLDCLYRDEADKEIFCLVKCDQSEWLNNKYFTHIIKAWRANRENEKIEEIPVTDLKCINSSISY